ncbi:MAG: hypothetical protein K2Y23_20040 [Cyanobacteria bacterium]|nr:hypothetical protein [Cyanobacteriota bacterium]
MLTSQFDAEFGASSGGVVNAVSKSGTNAIRGVLFYFNANQDMTAQNYFAARQNLPKADTKQLQWGGNVGGPIIKDKLHFFVNLERVDQNRARRSRSPTAAPTPIAMASSRSRCRPGPTAVPRTTPTPSRS